MSNDDTRASGRSGAAIRDERYLTPTSPSALPSGRQSLAELPSRKTSRSLARAIARFAPGTAIALAFAAFSIPGRAEPPRSATPSKPEAGATAPKSPAPGRSKAPAGATPPPPPAALKTEPDGPEAEGKARAQVIFEQAVAAYKEGRYFDAVELFLETNRIYPDSKLCFNIARAYEGLGSSAGALRYYREYLRRTPNAADKADVENNVRQLQLALSQKGVQQMSIFSAPDGAVLSIDGQPIALTPWTGETWPGKHRLTLTHPGYIEGQQIVELSPLRAVDVQLELKPEPSARPPTSAGAEQRSEQGHGIALLTVATLAAGAVLLGSALGVQLTHDSGTSSTAAFLGGAGVGATAVGGVLLYFDVSGSSSKSSTSATRD
jgi:tetratricopeptide (TPR) repeat protein